jgi:peptide/nickel transport system substrate-binding protein
MSARQDKRFIIAIVLVVIIAVGGTYAVMSSRITGTTATTITSASASTPASTNALSGGTIVSEEPCCIDSLDPAISFTSMSMELVENVYQALVINPVGGGTKMVPFLATSYNVSADGMTYTFQIRQNITFSNGDPLNSYVFWYSIYRDAVMAQDTSFMVTIPLNTTSVTASMLNQYTTPTPPASLIQIMQNPSNAIVAPNPSELIFHLANPFSPFVSTLTQSNGVAVDPVVVSAHGGVVAGQPNSWMNLNMVGTGPFVLTQYQPNEQAILEKNPTYWGGIGNEQPTPRVDRVVVKYVANALTRMEDVQRGSAQIAYLDPSLVAQAVSAGGIYVPTLGLEQMPCVMFWNLNTQKFPFNNKLIRLAVVHAINYTAALELFHGFGAAWVGPNPNGVDGYNPNLNPYSYNLTLARQLLAQAGYPNGQGIPPVTMIAATDAPPMTDIAAVVQSNLADIGIRVKIVAEPFASMLATISGNSLNSTAYPDMTANDWINFPDPWAFADWFVGPIGYQAAGGNSGNYNNTQVNNLLHQAAGTVDESQRSAIYVQISQIVYADAPMIWIAQNKNMFSPGVPIVSTTVGGYTPLPCFVLEDFSHLYLTSTT